jgi:hypothetical protein
LAEDLVLATPEVIPQITTSTYRLVGLSLDWERATIVIRLRGANGETKTFTYGGNDAPLAEKQKALNLMIALNKADLSVKSLQRRVLERLVADGLLAGAVSGTPD